MTVTYRFYLTAHQTRKVKVNTMAKINISVPTEPCITGSLGLPVVSGKSFYCCPLGDFVITEAAGFKDSGDGGTLNISGRFSISGVGDNFGSVTFAGTYVKDGGKGSGKVSWTGTHPPIVIPDGEDAWTSETITPAPPPDARAVTT